MMFHRFLPVALLSGTGEPSLWEELWTYFKGKYFSVDTGRYEHISIGSGSLVTVQNIVLGIALGIIVASAIACYDKNNLGAFVRAVIRAQCLSPEKAKTLSELGFLKKSGVKASLRSGHKLGRVVHCVEKETYEASVETARADYAAAHGGSAEGFHMPPYRMDFTQDHFYIPDEEHYRAEIRFENRGSGWRAFVLVVIVTVLGAALTCFLLPDMLQLVDNLVGILSENDKFLK